MATVISFANQKGGVAKTTSTFNVATSLAARGYRVLMIDLDPQASLTIYAGLEPYEYERTVVDVLKNPKQEIHECIVSDIIVISPRNLDSSLCFIQPSIWHDVLCI